MRTSVWLLATLLAACGSQDSAATQMFSSGGAMPSAVPAAGTSMPVAVPGSTASGGQTGDSQLSTLDEPVASGGSAGSTEALPSQPPSQETAPAEWQLLDIGKEANRDDPGMRCPDPDAMLTPGDFQRQDETWTLTGSGEGFIHGWDQGTLVYRSEPVEGDFTFSARIESMQMLDGSELDGAAEALINVRNDLHFKQPAQSIISGYMPRSNIAMARFRDLAGEDKWWYWPAWPRTWPEPQPLPLWARIERRGNSFTAYTSNNGENWEPLQENDPERQWYPFQLDDFGKLAIVGLVCSARNDRNLNDEKTADGCHDPASEHLTKSARCVFTDVTLTQP